MDFLAQIRMKKKPKWTDNVKRSAGSEVFEPAYECKYGRELMFYIVKVMLFLQFSLFTQALFRFLRTDSVHFFLFFWIFITSILC